MSSLPVRFFVHCPVFSIHRRCVDIGGIPDVENRLKAEDTVPGLGAEDDASIEVDVGECNDGSEEAELDADYDDADVGVVAEELPLFVTDNHDFTYRYLLTLTAWSAAMDYLCWDRDHIGTLPVGVAEKCCWACTRLSQRLLDKHEFTLPGSNGSVYPWSPPPFGIPLNVLSTLRDDLIATTTEWAIAQADREQRMDTIDQASDSDSSDEIEIARPPHPSLIPSIHRRLLVGDSSRSQRSTQAA
ncbi:hypothetical protein C8T65DRAFT_740199 [Cerioporus squamosus]|nr:hypothetical protein C8T65DRAFT_740199 [Cerioporus squamosus]